MFLIVLELFIKLNLHLQPFLSQLHNSCIIVSYWLWLVYIPLEG